MRSAECCCYYYLMWNVFPTSFVSNLCCHSVCVTCQLPYVSDNGPIACVLLVKGDNTNCRLAMAEYIKDTFRVA